MDAKTPKPAKVYDPVTFDIIENSLQAISDEMFVAMRKTAMSAIIYEVLDLGTGICSAEGEIASSGYRLRHAGLARDGDLHQHTHGETDARGCAGVSADQSPAGLPGVRSGG